MCPKNPDIFHLATFNSSLFNREGFIIKMVVFLFWNASFWLAFSPSFKKGVGERITNGRKPQIEVYKDHSFMLPATVSVGHFPRPDLTPVLWSTQRSRLRPAENSTDKSQTLGGSGEGLLRKKNKTVCRSAASLSSLMGPILRVPGRRHCGFPGEALVRESMCLIKYGFNGNIPFSSLHIPDSLIYL